MVAVQYKVGCSSLDGFDLVDVPLGVGNPYIELAYSSRLGVLSPSVLWS